MRSTFRLRPAAVAGTFYPGDPATLAATVDGLLAEARRRIPDYPEQPKALIAPHAGYVYSGPVAASAYAPLTPYAADIRRVVVLGPAHTVPLRGIALSSADVWRTPLGDVELDTDSVTAATAHRLAGIDDRAHAAEHSIEVHLPFLQRVLEPGWRLVPAVVGHIDAGTVADLLDLWWGGDETLVVVSTDLSHYHSYDVARRLDRRTAAEIVARQTALDPEGACGAYPLRGLLAAARRHDLDVELIDLRNSGDTAGGRDRVVGYGSFALVGATSGGGGES